MCVFLVGAWNFKLHVNKREGKTNGECADESVTFRQVIETVP